MSNPYVVHSTKGFLYLMNSALSGLSLSGKHLELACNVSLNDEKFDDDGKAYGGDGVIYSWQPVTGVNGICIYGKGYSISGLYINDPEMDNASMFNSQVNIVKDLNFEDFYVVGRERVSALCANQFLTSEIDNVNVLSGVVKGKGRVYALCFNTKVIKNCKSYAKVYQLEEGAIQEGMSGFISGGANVSIRDCVFYGKIVAYDVSYVGGFANTVRYGEIVNCKNYGTIEKKQVLNQ